LVVCGEWMSILYRNYAQEGSRNVERRLNTNLKNVFDSNMTNILSVSVRYFIDYNIIKISSKSLLSSVTIPFEISLLSWVGLIIDTISLTSKNGFLYFRFIYNLFHEIPFLTFFIFVITCGYSQKKYYKLSLPHNITIDGKLDEHMAIHPRSY
jgi:hypothetical protein